MFVVFVAFEPSPAPLFLLDLTFEIHQPVGPELLEPGPELAEARGSGSVPATGALGPDLDEVCVLEHSKVLGDRWPADGKRFRDLSHGEFLVANETQDAAAVGFGDGSSDGVHELQGRRLRKLSLTFVVTYQYDDHAGVPVTIDPITAAPETTDPATAELLDALDAVQANARRLVGEVHPDQWSLPTPCAEWDVTALVNHMAFSNLALGAAARRDAEGTVDPTADHLGSNRVQGFATTSHSSSASWRSPHATEGDVSTPFDMPAVGALSANVLDIGIHCWDLAHATGQDHGLSAAQVELIDACNRALINEAVRASGGFGDELDVDEKASALAKMLAFAGRRG